MHQRRMMLIPRHGGGVDLANFNAFVALAEVCYTTCPFMGRLAWAEKLKELKCDIFQFGGSQTLSQVAPTKVNAKGVKRPAHYRRNVEAIAAEQSSKEPAIPKKPFARLAKCDASSVPQSRSS